MHAPCSWSCKSPKHTSHSDTRIMSSVRIVSRVNVRALSPVRCHSPCSLIRYRDTDIALPLGRTHIHTQTHTFRYADVHLTMWLLRAVADRINKRICGDGLRVSNLSHLICLMLLWPRPLFSCHLLPLFFFCCALSHNSCCFSSLYLSWCKYIYNTAITCIFLC